MSKNFRSVDVLRKYFNTKFYNKLGRTYGESNCHGKVFPCICGYHVYEKVWAATVGEALVCEREPKNSSNRYAVAVKNEGTIIE